MIAQRRAFISKLMKTEEEYPKGKKYRATTLQKIQLQNWKLQTSLNELKSVSKGQTDDVLNEIERKMKSQSPVQIKEGLKTLGNMLLSDQRERSHSIGNKFIPGVLNLINGQNHSSVVCESIHYLAKVISFGKLSEECLKLFEERGIQLLVRLVKEERSDYKGQLQALVANLTIESVAMRDLFIEKGAVDAMLQALQTMFTKHQKRKLESSRSIQNIYFALIALALGDPLPPRHKVQKAVNRVVADIDNSQSFRWTPIYSEENIYGGCLWLVYHYLDYRDEKQCSILLQRLLQYQYSTSHSFFHHHQQKRLFYVHLHQIYIQIYDYYSVKPDNKIMPILHGSFYKDPPLKEYQIWEFFQYYTPKMYQNLFRATLPHKITERGINLLLEYPWKQAISFLKQEDEYTDRVLTLEFILWVLKQMASYTTYDSSKQLKKQPRSIDTCLIASLLRDIESNLFILKKLRHDNRRLLASLSSAVIKACRELSINKGYNFSRYKFKMMDI